MYYNMMSKILNAIARKKKKVVSPYSRQCETILSCLLAQNYIKDYQIKEDGIFKNLEITLKYIENISCISQMKLVSKPSLRKYYSVKNINKMARDSTIGMYIVSTNRGVKSHYEAVNENIGGEVLCYIS